MNWIRLLGVLGLLWVASPVGAAELNLRVSHVADKGAVHVYVFTTAEGFPKEDHAAVHVAYAELGGAQMDVVIQVPEAAEYAVMAYQDKNGDGKMNRLLGMIPQEPYGLSRNPQLFGKPKFADAAIHPAAGEVITLELHD